MLCYVASDPTLGHERLTSPDWNADWILRHDQKVVSWRTNCQVVGQESFGEDMRCRIGVFPSHGQDIPEVGNK